MQVDGDITCGLAGEDDPKGSCAAILGSHQSTPGYDSYAWNGKPKHISCTATDITGIANQSTIPIQRYCRAKGVAGGGIAGDKPRSLAPGTPNAGEQIG